MKSLSRFIVVLELLGLRQAIVPMLLLLLMPLSAGAGNCVIGIDSQEKFSQMNDLLTKAIADGETDIVVEIAKGVYYFREHHLLRRHENSPAVSISIQGHDAVLIAAGNDYSDGDRYQADFNPDAVFIDADSLKAFDFWDHCRYADGLVEVVGDASEHRNPGMAGDASKRREDGKESRLCRLPVSPLPSGEGSGVGLLYINIPQWYYSGTYKVEKAEKGCLYFTVPNLEYVVRGERQGYNVNYDYIFGGQDIRFRLCNPPIVNGQWSMVNGQRSMVNGQRSMVNGQRSIHECRSRCFLYCKDTAYKSFTLSGLRFLGNSSGSFLIKLDSMATEDFSITQCQFEAIKGNVLWAKSTPNITFCHNSIDHCDNGIFSSNSCVNTRVTNNAFSNCGGNMMATFCVNSKGKDFYIAHNQFRNFGYAAVGVGIWYGHEKKQESSGIIEYNEMWCDPGYIAHKERYTLQDTGALYIWPKNDSVTVRYNYIHDIDGMLLNRGIFCDDGASHFRLYGNVVVGIANSYSIDSRNCDKKFAGANIDNRMEGNIVDSAIKFEGSSAGADPVSARDNGCVVSGNVMLCREGEEPPENIYSRLTTERPDQQIAFEGHGPDGIVIDRRQMERLRGLPHAENAIKAAKWRYR